MSLEDAEILARDLDLTNLYKEKATAELHIREENEDSGYWEWFLLVIIEAIDLKKLHPVQSNKYKSFIDIEGLKSRINIMNLIGGYGIELKKAGINFKGCCPFHTEKTPSFIVYPQENRYHCFGCMADGDVISFIQKMENLDFKTAVEKLNCQY